ncbi:glycosyltransferase [uncultured Sunxiuqinia sp.]|uniref:glycosyltransferase n=1 Tax=uncultured Sunxiuqinia sp. TaxID=1573825 RepID=UPI0026346B25|nr:glycosyltransferase [uncultured Sunxiuqinia sp.]
MTKKLHIVSFNVPDPPNYGGIIDVYYKIRSLAQANIDIILHCFQYGRDTSSELEKLCHQVHYYPRKKGLLYLLSTSPYIVNTRRSKQLLENLQQEIVPILFEGLHTCYYLNHPLLGAFKKIVRTHNVEHDYYHHLALSEQNLFYKYYYKQEALKLRCFEKRLKRASAILSISPDDTRYFKTHYQMGDFIPAFHPFDKVETRKGLGEYILFHGNLSVNENQQAVRYLLDRIFTEITLPVMIAGKNPPEWLIQKAAEIPHVTLISNPDMEVMNHLIQHAQINLIPTFQSTGLKLKLLASLFLGRHCITNSPMVSNTGLSHLCYLADNIVDMIQLIQQKFEEEITTEEINQRKEVLENQFSNEKNAQKIYALI